ncbi:MAG: patatin family protein [Prevotella sp.]|nr:patatin family protein [Prevotella sp.]
MRGLVLEGGAMRGLFSAGVIDELMSMGWQPDGIIGVSAGAAFGCNMKSGQPGRAIRYNKRFARDPQYCSIRSLLLTGNLFNAAYAYHYVPDYLDVFDKEAFRNSPMAYYVVCTDVATGKPVYQRLDHVDYEALEWIRASASMPLCSRMVELDGKRLLDGGVSDSIPLRAFQQMGYGRNIVVLTQPEGYRKHPLPLPVRALLQAAYRRHPAFARAMAVRHEMYNRQLDYVKAEEQAGRALVIRPPRELPIGHISHDPDEMQQVYQIGRQTVRQTAAQIKEFLL